MGKPFVFIAGRTISILCKLKYKSYICKQITELFESMKN